MISFKGTVADYTTVKKINTNYGYMITNQPAVLGELNPLDGLDQCTTKKLPYLWGSKGSDVHFIADNFEYLGHADYSDIVSRFFCLTTQTEGLSKILPAKIMGLMQASRIGKNKTQIDYMQVNPFFVYNNPYSKFMNVGKTALESFIKLFKNDEISLYSPKQVIGFFEKCGFYIAKEDGLGDVLMKLRR